MTKKESLKELQTLKNVGKSISEELYSIGIKRVNEFRKHDAEELYEKLKKKSGGKLDRCVLYTFRGAKQNKVWWKCM